MCSVRRYFWWTLDFFQPQTWFWIIKEIPFRFITKNQCQSQGFSFVASASLQSPRWTIESRWHYPEDAQKFGNSHDEFPHGYGWTQWRKSTWLRSTWFGLTTMKSSCHNIHLFMHLMTCLHRQNDLANGGSRQSRSIFSIQWIKVLWLPFSWRLKSFLEMGC